MSGTGGRVIARISVSTLALLTLAAVAVAPARAQVADGGTTGPSPSARLTPQEDITRNVRLEQKMNAQVPLDLTFRDESGKSVRLANYFGRKPVMLVLIQYRCTMLCSEQMNVLSESLRELKFTPGKEFELVTVSIDPREQPDLAADTKRHYLQSYGRPEGAAGWHFLTGDEGSIQRLADSVGFHFRYDERTDQYAHPDGVIILTPEGHVARYFFRLEYPAQGLRFGLVEAADRKIGSPLDAIALLCYHYDPVTGKYGLVVMKLLQFAAVLTVLGIGGGILVMRQWDRRAKRRIGDEALQAESYRGEAS